MGRRQPRRRLRRDPHPAHGVRREHEESLAAQCPGAHALGPADAFTVPPGEAWRLGEPSEDLAQLVEPGVTLVNTMTNEGLDHDGVIAKFGVRPEQVLDPLALTGDSIDNVPGVAKVGPKTAAEDRRSGGRFTKDRFCIDLAAGTVTCPARVTVAIRPARRGGGRAGFGVACSVCPLRQACTSSVRGRVVAVHLREAELAAARARQRDPVWLADYRATRPKVERKLAHLLRRRHGGRRARVRGLVRVAQDFRLLAAAVNLARFATLGLRSMANGWQVQPT